MIKRVKLHYVKHDVLLFLKKNFKKKYSKKFFKKIFKKKYLKKLRNLKENLLTFTGTYLWAKKLPINVSFKPYFHIKNIFNLNDFLLYDFYNFHKNLLINKFKKTSRKIKRFLIKPWKKINFFFYIRRSVLTFRSHTLRFFKTYYRNDRHNTIFFKGFNGLATMSYIWFFEFSITYFLIKIKFSESMNQSLVLLQRNCIFLNHSTVFNRWCYINQGDVIQLQFNIFWLMRVRILVLKLLRFFRKTRRFLRKTLFKPKKYRLRMPNLVSKSQYLNAGKAAHYKLYESDYKSLSIILIPYSNPKVYWNLLTLFWLNLWNYRLNIWKYDI